MLPDSLRFVWGNPSVPGARWTLGVFSLARPPRTNREIRRRAQASAGRAVPKPESVLRVSLRGVLIWSTGLSLATYLAGAAWIAHRLDSGSAHNRIGYLDLVLPTRWDRHDRLRGEAMLAEAREKLEGGDYREGLTLLRAGLSRVPGDHESRLVLAQLFSRSRFMFQAWDILTNGLEYGYPGRESMATLCMIGEQSDLKAELPALIRQARIHLLVTADTSDPETRDALRELDVQETEMLLRLDRHSEVLELAARLPEADPMRFEFEIAAHLKSERPDQAQDVAARWIALDPRSATALKQHAAASRQAGDIASMEDSLRHWARLDPTQFEPFLQAVIEQHLAGRADAADEALNLLLLRHGADPSLYPAACKKYGDIGYEAGLERLRHELESRGFPLTPVWLTRLETAEKARDWAAVIDLVARLQAAPADTVPASQRAWLAVRRTLAEVCLVGESGAEVHLLELVSDAFFPCATYVRILEPLVESGKWRAADGVLTLAEGPYPKSPTLARFRVRITAALEAQAAQTAAEHATKPQQHATWEEFLALHQTSLAEGKPDEALERINEIRRRRPDWLANASHKLDELELALIARNPDTLRIQMLARSLAARNPEARERLLTLARELFATHPEHTRILFQSMIGRSAEADPLVAEFETLFPPPKAQDETAGAGTPSDSL